MYLLPLFFHWYIKHLLSFLKIERKCIPTKKTVKSVLDWRKKVDFYPLAKIGRIENSLSPFCSKLKFIFFAVQFVDNH